MTKMAMVIRDDGYDRLLTPLMFAYVEAKKGVRVDLLFTLWAVRVLTESGLGALKIAGTHAPEEPWLRERLLGYGSPVEIRDFLQGLRQTGQVGIYGCAIAAAVLGVVEKDLIPVADGLIHPSKFLEEKALAADHTSYF